MTYLHCRELVYASLISESGGMSPIDEIGTYTRAAELVSLSNLLARYKSAEVGCDSSAESNP